MPVPFPAVIAVILTIRFVLCPKVLFFLRCTVPVILRIDQMSVPFIVLAKVSYLLTIAYSIISENNVNFVRFV